MGDQKANVPSWMTKEYLEGVLGTVYKTPVVVKEKDIGSASAAGDGYTCQIFRIRLKIHKNGADEDLSLIGKVLPKTNLSDELTKTFNIFEVEVNFLMKTWPRIQEKFPKAKFAPTAYYLDEFHQAIFMEDCCASGYKMIDPPGKALDMDHALAVMRVLAKLNAYSHLMIQLDPSLKETFSDYFWKEREGALGVDMQLSNKGLEYILEKLDKWTVSEDLKKRLRNLTGRIVDVGLQAYARKDDGMNVLAHGDGWTNNLMFKYEGDRVVDAKLLDYQFTSYNAIGIDLNFFIFTSIDGRIQMHRLGELFEEYFNTFVGITGPIPGFTLDTVWKEFYAHLGLGFICFYIFRAGIIGAPIAFDLDAMTRGEESEINRGLFQSDYYISEGSRMLPFFAEHGII